MNERKTEIQNAEHQAADYQIGIVDILEILAIYKRRIVLIPVVSAVIAVAITFALPITYLSSVKILPPQQSQSSASAVLSQLGGVVGSAAGLSGLRTSSDLYIGMLKSRTVADKLISRFGLKAVYETSSQETARRILSEKTSINSGKDGFIVIDVEDADRSLAAKMANGYVDELSRLTSVLAVTEAGQRRMFFERQFELAKNNLSKAEFALKQGMDKSGVISVDKESEAIVMTLARLGAQISAKEIEINSMRAFVTENNPQYRRAEEELRSLRNQQAKLENGSPSTVPQRAAGSDGLASINLLRDVKYYQMLYELLAKQYELARLDEAKEPALIQVLDPAVEAEKSNKPRRVFITLLAAIAGVVLALVSAFFSEGKRRYLRTAAGLAKWTAFKQKLAQR